MRLFRVLVPSVLVLASGLLSPAIAPYPSAPACPHPNNDFYHDLWDEAAGCHYDHEHGDNPFTAAVRNTFPDFGLSFLLGGRGVGTPVPSSPMENTHKHGGFKWTVAVPTPKPCYTGFEGAEYGIDAAVVEYHNFGDYGMELETRDHTALALVRQCRPGSTDYGYVFVVAIQDYGQRLYAYQGDNMPYPDAPSPYPTGLAPYWSNDCIFCGAKRDTLGAVLAANGNIAATVTSKGDHVFQQPVFRLLWRARDNYRLVDRRDGTYPFTYVWACTATGGTSFDQRPGCRWNNSTSRVHEVRIIVPASWDGLAGFDRDTRAGRVTGRGYMNQAGQIDLSCTAPSLNCLPVKAVRAYVGHSGAEIVLSKSIQFGPGGLPERDIYFCGGQLCAEGDYGAESSGWIGPNN